MEDEILTPPTPTMFRFPDEATGMAALDAAGCFSPTRTATSSPSPTSTRLPDDKLKSITS